jgi:membrane protein implicated in regulation of membrane protease activity
MTGWMWLIVGIGLCVAELIVVSGFFLFLLGVSAIVLGLLVLTGLFTTWPIQALVFCALAVVAWIVFANRLQSVMGSPKEAVVGTKGRVIKVGSAIAPGELGAGELWGSTWRLKNVGGEPIPAGSECLVVEAEGVTLHVTLKD